jgi:uncharacterized protein (TIGR04141 family)
MAGSTIGKRHKLTAFLIKEGYAEIKDFLSVGKLNSLPVSSAGSEGTLFFKSGFESQPAWASIFTDVPNFNPKSIVNRGSRALYVTQVKDRWFCFTFGYTRHLIAESAIERNFGLIVALNMGDPSAFKAIDKTNISHVALQSREQASRDVGFEGFEFDTDIDLLKSITAKSPEADGEEQETYSGRDSITIYTRVNIATFADIATRLHKAYQKKTYRRRYPWIDKITQERDSGVLQSLDDAMVAKINSEDLGKIWLAVPDILNWEEIDGFTYRVPNANPKKAGPVLHPDIDLNDWMTETKLQGQVTLVRLRDRKVFRCFKDGTEPAAWPIYRCLNAEIDLGAKKYVLNDGDWYNVDSNYVKDIESFYTSIEDSKLSLPKFGAKTEPDYLEGLTATHPQFAIMDRKLVMTGSGKSRIEFCDIYSKSKDIIHVKKYGGSSVLSHLFNQALVSAECLLYEQSFRETVMQLLPAGFKFADPKKTPVANAHTVCIAIMSKVKGPLEIPFFSKVSMKHTVKALRRMDFKVTKLKIER